MWHIADEAGYLPFAGDAAAKVKCLPFQRIERSVVARDPSVELLVQHGAIAVEVDVAQIGDAEKSRAERFREPRGGGFAGLPEPLVAVYLQARELQTPGIGVGQEMGVHAEEFPGEEVVLHHRPVLRQESVDVPAHQHLPKRMAVGIAGGEGVLVEFHVFPSLGLLRSQLVRPRARMGSLAITSPSSARWTKSKRLVTTQTWFGTIRTLSPIFGRPGHPERSTTACSSLR